MTESTKNRIVDDYWWKGMTRDIDEYISRCMTCQRHENFTPIEHPAKALRVGKPFEIVQMDIVGGFPTTSRGYKRILVFQMKFLKVIKVYPITSKDAIGFTCVNSVHQK